QTCALPIWLTLPVTAQVGEEVMLGIRPEHFGLPGAGDADLTLEVDVAEHLGSTSFVYARSEGEPLVIEREESRHEIGQRTITVSISGAKGYPFAEAGQRSR